MNTVMDSVVAEARARLSALQQVTDDLQSAATTCTGDDGRVRVTVDAGGALAELHLAPGAGRGDAARLAAEILQTAARAATEMAGRREAILREFLDEHREFGGGPDTADTTDT